jgi:hypothetical protein
MRIVVGPEPSMDLKQAELHRHREILSRFVARIASEGAEPRRLTMILRSAESSAAEALIAISQDLCRAGIAAKVVIAKLEPDDALRQLFGSLSRLSPHEPAKQLIRWARNPRLLDAHEQVTYGAAMCWSGDAMRRETGKRNGLSLFDDAAPGTARLGQLAFEALWSASVEIAERRLLGSAAPKPSGAYHGESASRVAPISPLRPGLQGWPLIRH